MDDYLLVYLWTRLSIVSYLFTFLFIIITIIIISYFCNTKDEFDFWISLDYLQRENSNKLAEEYNKNLFLKYKNNKFVRWCIILFICIGSLNLIIPSKKDAMLIYVLPKVANSSTLEEWDKVFNSLPKAVQKILDEYIPEKEIED